MLILGSNSETRANILKENGIEFSQMGCDFDEDSIIADTPKSFVLQATKGKFSSCLKNLTPNDSLLVADTVVSVGDRILRKAKDEREARELLSLQSGSKVSIITAMIYKREGLELLDLSSTDYIFREFSQRDIDLFISSGEWRGKAGACMVEGFCGKYIESVHGLQSCAMGLSFEKLEGFL